MLKNLPTTRSPIDHSMFVHVLTDSEREAVRELMISHGMNIGDVRSLELHRRDAVYTIYRTLDDGGFRYVDAETGEVAVRTERHKIK